MMDLVLRPVLVVLHSTGYNCMTHFISCKTLKQFKCIYRLSAQTVEEGHYVMGKQLDIPSEFSGVFKICCDYEREEISLQV